MGDQQQAVQQPQQQQQANVPTQGRPGWTGGRVQQVGDRWVDC
jgi:hypothetical protein